MNTLPSFYSDLYREASLIENDVVDNALNQFLKRTQTDEDYRRCERIFKSGDETKYALLYDKIFLGLITRQYNVNTYTVTFDPKGKL